jgi:Cyclopropane fatty acid synthase and related methyltransferases
LAELDRGGQVTCYDKGLDGGAVGVNIADERQSSGDLGAGDSAGLTEETYWDSYWSSVSLPREITRRPGRLYLNAILDVFDRFVPKSSGQTVLEVGGAPGQYLAYMHRAFGAEVHCLDYSAMGCSKAEENLALLNIPGCVHRVDLFDPDVSLGPFDVVYSLGFIEHFSNLVPVVARHLALLKPGGLLILGAPNFLGVNRWFLSRLAPELLAKHNLLAMDVDNWAQFEDTLGLLPIWKGYVGGFEPSILDRWEGYTPSRAALRLLIRAMRKVLTGHFSVLRRVNTKRTSGYVMGVYQKPMT